MLRAAFAAGCERGGFRLVHYAVMNDHLHLIVEAEDAVGFVRGVQGLLIRVARALNRLWGRKGKVFADRFHDHHLATPTEVRNALRYVLANAEHHARQHAPHMGRNVQVGQVIDMFTSGPWFDGWLESIVVRGLESEARPVARPRTWLLGVGWQRPTLETRRPAQRARTSRLMTTRGVHQGAHPELGESLSLRVRSGPLHTPPQGHAPITD